MANPVVHIMPWEYERCFAVGAGRFTANWGVPDAPHYERTAMEEDRNAQVAAAICELAVAKYVNQYWHAGVWHRTDHGKYKSIADVGSNIEVRRVRTRDAVAVRKKDSGKVVWGAKVADPEYRTVELLGYVSADDVIASLLTDYVYVDISDLTKPWE
jgi:hypothetical protein